MKTRSRHSWFWVHAKMRKSVVDDIHPSLAFLSTTSFSSFDRCWKKPMETKKQTCFLCLFRVVTNKKKRQCKKEVSLKRFAKEGESPLYQKPKKKSIMTTNLSPRGIVLLSQTNKQTKKWKIECFLFSISLSPLSLCLLTHHLHKFNHWRMCFVGWWRKGRRGRKNKQME